MYSDYPCTCHLESRIDKFVLSHPTSSVHPSAHLSFMCINELQTWLAFMLKLFSNIASLEPGLSLKCSVPILAHWTGCGDVDLELQPFGKLRCRISGAWEVQGRPGHHSEILPLKTKRSFKHATWWIWQVFTLLQLEHLKCRTFLPSWREPCVPVTSNTNPVLIGSRLLCRKRNYPRVRQVAVKLNPSQVPNSQEAKAWRLPCEACVVYIVNTWPLRAA